MAAWPWRNARRLIEDILLKLWCDIVSRDDSGPPNFALVATGGFGRGWLFPYSDIDLLFLYGDRDGEQAFRDPVRRFSQELWDLRLKLSPARSRTHWLECDRYDANKHRVHHFSSRLPLSRGRSRPVPETP